MARVFAQEDGNLSTRPITTSRTTSYTDIDLTFTNKSNGEIFKKTDAASVKQAVRNLLMTNKGEKPFNPHYGGNLNDYLFSLSEDIDNIEIENAIMLAIDAQEPRAAVRGVQVLLKGDYNSIHVLVQFQVVNTLEIAELNLELTRLR